MNPETKADLLSALRDMQAGPFYDFYAMLCGTPSSPLRTQLLGLAVEMAGAMKRSKRLLGEP